MRAGLLSNPQVIRLVNERFVSTWIIVADLMKLADKEHRLAKALAANWEYPLDLMFLTPDGRLVSKLNASKDLGDVHRDVETAPQQIGRGGPSHVDVFLKHVEAHFGED